MGYLSEMLAWADIKWVVSLSAGVRVTYISFWFSLSHSLRGLIAEDGRYHSALWNKDYVMDFQLLDYFIMFMSSNLFHMFRGTYMEFFSSLFLKHQAMWDSLVLYNAITSLQRFFGTKIPDRGLKPGKLHLQIFTRYIYTIQIVYCSNSTCIVILCSVEQAIGNRDLSVCPKEKQREVDKRVMFPDQKLNTSNFLLSLRTGQRD